MTRVHKARLHYAGLWIVPISCAVAAFCLPQVYWPAKMAAVLTFLLPPQLQNLYFRQFFLGSAKMRVGEFQAAEGHFTTFLKQLERRPWINHLTWMRGSLYGASARAMAASNLGSCLLEQNRFEQAQTAFNLALEEFPEYAIVHFNLAVLLYKLGRLPQARAHLQQAQQYGFRDSLVEQWLSRAAMDLAQRTQQVPVRQNPQMIQGRTLVYLALGDWERARCYCQQALGQSKELGHYLFLLLHLRLREWPEAEKHLSALGPIADESPPIAFYFHALTGDFESAKGLTKDPKLLAEILLTEGHLDQAEPRSDLSLVAWQCWLQGRVEDALSTAEQALDDPPYQSYALQVKALALHQLGQQSASEVALGSFIHYAETFRPLECNLFERVAETRSICLTRPDSIPDK